MSLAQLEYNHPRTASPLQVRAAGVSDVGGRDANEDAYVVARMGLARSMDSNLDDLRVGGPPEVLLAVADGMGGHRAGDVASETVIRLMASGCEELFPATGPASTARILESLVQDCQQAVEAIPLEEVTAERGSAPGTTLTAIYASDEWAVLAHVGDSRCYLLRNDTLRQLTEDHTVAEALLRAGASDPNPMTEGVLTSALGAGIDDPELQLEGIHLQHGDRLLLCSDGLHDALDDAQIHAILREGVDPKAISWALYGAATTSGATDNVTAVVADVRAAWAPPAVVSRVFASVDAAEEALQVLRDAQFHPDDIRLLERDAAAHPPPAGDVERHRHRHSHGP